MRAASLSAFLVLPLTTFAAETIIGAYIFHRHGDRTPKAFAPVSLTGLGYREVYDRGSYYRSRYVSSDATNKISGVNPDLVRQAQIAVSAPVDDVLQNSAAGFMQALYPPAGQIDSESLRNGSKVETPMGGFQLVPVNIVSRGTDSEESGWLQGASGCLNAKTSSNSFFSSDQYQSLLSETYDFYQSLLPVVNGTFDSSSTTFKNAYTVYDLINVAAIHNSSINSPDVLTDETLFQLQTLADSHEFGLAYNSSDEMRAIAGMQLAGEVVNYLNSTIASFPENNNKLGVQFGPYATFLSFFGLAALTSASPDFYGIPDYASSMVFELFTNADMEKGVAPNQDELQVRFLFHNGTSANQVAPTAYPLFGLHAEAISWRSFTGNMSAFSVSTSEQWCVKCGNFTGLCAAFEPADGSGGSVGGRSRSGAEGSRISSTVGGVIGAMVTFAVVLGVQALILLLGGLRVVSKKRMAGATARGETIEELAKA